MVLADAAQISNIVCSYNGIYEFYDHSNLCQLPKSHRHVLHLTRRFSHDGHFALDRRNCAPWLSERIPWRIDWVLRIWNWFRWDYRVGTTNTFEVIWNVGYFNLLGCQSISYPLLHLILVAQQAEATVPVRVRSQNHGWTWSWIR